MPDEQKDQRPAMPDLEAVYDEKIFPLMEQILTVCKEHGMPMVACFQYSADGFCESLIAPPNADKRITMAAQFLRKGFLTYAVMAKPAAGPAGGVPN